MTNIRETLNGGSAATASSDLAPELLRPANGEAATTSTRPSSAPGRASLSMLKTKDTSEQDVSTPQASPRRDTRRVSFSALDTIRQKAVEVEAAVAAPARTTSQRLSDLVGALQAQGDSVEDTERLSTLQACRALYEALPPEQRDLRTLDGMAGLLAGIERPDAEVRKCMGPDACGPVKAEFDALAGFYKEAQATAPKGVKPTGNPYLPLVGTLNALPLDHLLPGIGTVKEIVNGAPEPLRMEGLATLCRFVHKEKPARMETLHRWMGELVDAQKANPTLSKEDAFAALDAVGDSVSDIVEKQEILAAHLSAESGRPVTALHPLCEEAFGLRTRILSLKDELDPGHLVRLSVQAHANDPMATSLTAAQKLVMDKRGPGSAFQAARSAIEGRLRLGPVADEFGIPRRFLQLAVWKEKYRGMETSTVLPLPEAFHRDLRTNPTLVEPDTGYRILYPPMAEVAFKQNRDPDSVIRKYGLHPEEDAAGIRDVRQLTANAFSWLGSARTMLAGRLGPDAG